MTTTRRSRTHPPGRDRWMVSYLDVLTILLIFFLTAAAKTGKTAPPVPHSPQPSPALASCSPQPAPEPPRAVEASSAVREAAAEPLKQDADPALVGVASKLAREGLGLPGPHRIIDLKGPDQIMDLRGPDQGDQRGLTISLPQAVLFAPGDDRIRAAAIPTLAKIAAALSAIPNKVNFAGHADSTPIHNRRFRNNRELAAARSLRLMEALTGRDGIDESRVSLSSYGSAEPKSPNDTASGRASNRRVEILIFSERSGR
ncbi:MAG TPA: flagellar motor protein MotB [Bryobacteraceae bacterium]|nr:flagellar motor protein MotB [Bryobacteraceae bacterium]